MLKEEKETLDLIDGVLNKNRISEEIFYNRYKKIIEDYIKSKFPNVSEEDFEDCVSNILIKIFYSLDKYDPDKSGFKTWVLTITKHYMIDIWRCKTTITYNASNDFYPSNSTCCCTFDNNENGLPEWTNNIITESNTYSYNNDINSLTLCSSSEYEICSSINHISNQISTSDFTLLNMKYVQGYEYCEIGKEFNISSNTASNRVNYLKTKLKKNNGDLIFD
jgi:RNA polymerase sigma factor (sigma-70 family)